MGAESLLTGEGSGSEVQWLAPAHTARGDDSAGLETRSLCQSESRC